MKTAAATVAEQVATTRDLRKKFRVQRLSIAAPASGFGMIKSKRKPVPAECDVAMLVKK